MQHSTIIIRMIFLLSLGFAQTQIGDDIDGEKAGDWFGVKVTISDDGNRIAIGGEKNTGNGTAVNPSGHVRVFHLTNGSWTQLGSDIDGEGQNDLFGWPVSLSSDGSRLAIGADNNDGGGIDAGHVRIFEYNGANWVQLGSDIDGEAAGDKSGYTVSLSGDGNRVAIGGRYNDDGGNQAGYIRVFEYNGANWVQLGSDIDGEAAGDVFGSSVAIDEDGSHFAAGAAGNDDGGNNAGHVRIFEYNGNNWVQVGSDIDGEAANDRSGEAVSIDSDGDRVAIGAPGNDGSGNNAGHVRIFEYNGANWVQVGSDIDGETANDVSSELGSIAMDSDGDYVVIGAYGNDGGGNNAGHARVYKYENNSWSAVGYDIEGEAAGDQSGFSVAIDSDGDRVIIGAWLNDGTGIDAGHARVYDPHDLTSPTITDVNLANDNSYADVTFSEAVYSTNGGSGALEVSDLELLFTQNNGDATNVSVSSIKQADNTDANSASALAGGEKTIRVFLTITGCPSGVEQIRFQAEANSIYDPFGNMMATGVPSTPENLNTSCPPTIELTTITSDNSTISVTWSELVYNTNAGNGALEESDFSLSIVGGVATVAPTPSSISVNNNVYTLGLNLTGTPSGGETLTVVPSSATAIYDATGGAASTTQSNNSVKLNDKLSPTITNTTIASNNSTITVTWSEAVFGSTGGTGNVEVSDYIFSLAGGVATLGSTTPTSIDLNGTDMTLGLSISGAPNGTEVLTVNPINNTSIFDGSDNAAINNQSNNTVNLNDQSPPTIVITAAEGVDGFSSRDATISLTFTVNEATTNFIEPDVTVSNGTLSSFRSVSNTVYTATLTPSAHGEVTIDVGQNTFTDANGNNNIAAEQFNWFYDIQGPTIIFNPVNGSTGIALNSNITIEFSEPIRHLDNGEITDANVDALIRLKTPIHSGTDIGFDATIDAAKQVITIDPTANFAYAQTVWVGIGESVEDEVNNAIISAAASFTTTDTNRAPVLYTIGNQTTFEDVAISLVLSATDADGEGITFSASASDTNVTVAVIDSLLTIYPGLNWHGAANITVMATDSGPGSLTDSETFTLTVRPVNDTPTDIVLSPDSVKENLSSGIFIGRFTTADVDTGESFIYNLVSGNGTNDADNDKFTIVNDSLRANAVFDYETKDSLNIRILTKDLGGLAYTENMVVYVIDTPDPVIASSTPTLTFGDVIVTRTNTKSLTINSAGTDTVVIDSVTVSGKGFALTDRTYPVKVAPGLSTDFEFSFGPDTLGQFSGNAIFHAEYASGIRQIILEGIGVNDTIPPVITHTVTPIPTNENQNVTITVPVTDENKITDVTLHYRIGGNTATFNQAASSNGDGTYSATINSANIGINGLAYYHTATDEYNNLRIGDTLSVKVQYGKNVLNSSASGSAYPNGIPKSRWRLISIPTHLDLSTINETLGDELVQEAGEQTWRLFEDQGNANWIEAQDIKIGKGYWLQQRIKDDLSFSVGSGKSVDLRNHTIRIPAGWSLIGNPYPFDISINTDKTKLYGPLTYGKSGLEGWDGEVTTLSPWEGYAVYNRTNDSLSVELNALPLATSIKTEDELNGWQIVLKVDNGEYGDLFNVIGQRSSASEQLDLWDKPEPPKLEKYIALEMNRPSWGIDVPFTTDIRPIDQDNDSWTMTINTKDVNGPISLDAELIGNLNPGITVSLFDPIERRSYPLFGDSKIQFKRIRDEYDYPFTVLVGTSEYIKGKTADLIAQLPESFSLGQNYPNPFNPITRIPFTVPVPSHIQLTIYNLMGREVASLANRWYDMGQFHITWDGRDNQGNPLSSGMYFYSLESTDFRKAKKLILLK